MENITLPTQLVNATLQYLATRPYQEVAALIAEIQKQATPPVATPEVEHQQ
jgi:hypothetical protein